jgi:hypothetical protein
MPIGEAYRRAVAFGSRSTPKRDGEQPRPDMNAWFGRRESFRDGNFETASHFDTPCNSC